MIDERAKLRNKRAFKLEAQIIDNKFYADLKSSNPPQLAKRILAEVVRTTITEHQMHIRSDKCASQAVVGFRLSVLLAWKNIKVLITKLL